MAINKEPIQDDVRIVNDDGTPTPYFMRWLRERLSTMEDTSDGVTAANEELEALRLVDLADYNAIVAPTAGQVVAWDAVNSKWKPVTAASGASARVHVTAGPILTAATITTEQMLWTLAIPAGTLSVNGATLDLEFWALTNGLTLTRTIKAGLADAAMTQLTSYSEARTNNLYAVNTRVRIIRVSATTGMMQYVSSGGANNSTLNGSSFGRHASLAIASVNWSAVNNLFISVTNASSAAAGAMELRGIVVDRNGITPI